MNHMALPIPGRSYYLVPKCAQDLCVGLNIEPVEAAYASALLQPRMRDVPFQRWIARATGDAATSGYGFELYVNHVYKTVLTYPHQIRTCIFSLTGRNSLEPQNGAVGLTKSDSPEDGTPAFQLWNVLPNGDFFALQNADNPDENLNVAGDGPYPEGTGILAWAWSGGAPNELWKFVEFGWASAALSHSRDAPDLDAPRRCQIAGARSWRCSLARRRAFRTPSAPTTRAAP